MTRTPYSRFMTGARAGLTALVALALTGCMTATPAASLRPAGVPATLAEAGKLDRATLVKLTGATLKEAVAAGQTEVIAEFVSYADGQDPDPAASREIARMALAGTMTTAATSDLARIASGEAHVQMAAAKTQIEFPEDEGSHRSALSEWWYLNGHLKGADGTSYGYEFTLFKIGPLLHWAHAALTNQHGQRFSYSRQWIPPHKAKGATDRLDLDYAGQAIERLADGRYRLHGNADGHTFDLTLATQKQPLMIGGDGKIDMPEGKDSWYYSLTRLEGEGSVDGQPVSAVSWMDHQWGPFWVSGFADRWDWFALQFEDNTEYNLFGFRQANGKAGARHVNQSLPTGRGFVGTRFEMDRLGWWKSPRTGKFYTTKWRVTLPETQEIVELEATNEDQEVARVGGFLRDPLPSYWEGSLKAVKITADGRRIPGVSYCEHFGFGTPQGPR